MTVSSPFLVLYLHDLLPGIVWQREDTEAILRGRGRSHAGQEVGWGILGACWTVSRALLDRTWTLTCVKLFSQRTVGLISIRKCE